MLSECQTQTLLDLNIHVLDRRVIPCACTYRIGQCFQFSFWRMYPRLPQAHVLMALWGCFRLLLLLSRQLPPPFLLLLAEKICMKPQRLIWVKWRLLISLPSPKRIQHLLLLCKLVYVCRPSNSVSQGQRKCSMDLCNSSIKWELRPRHGQSDGRREGMGKGAGGAGGMEGGRRREKKKKEIPQKKKKRQYLSSNLPFSVLVRQFSHLNK